MHRGETMRRYLLRMLATGFLIGVIVGILLAAPLGWWWSRRTAAEVRQLEQRARTAERLAEMGTLAGGLAHEIKNPLSTIGLNLQLLQEDMAALSDGGPLPGDAADKLGRTQRRLESLRREADRLRDILEDFLRFAGRMKLDLQPVDLHAVVQELVDFFEPQAAASGVQVRTQLQASPSVAAVDAALLKQALLNLLINATQAMQQAREKDAANGGARDLIIRTESTGDRGREIELHVIDTGPGIASDVQEKVFQPYFSTKRGGTGLGLPTSRRIVEEHGGRITVHSEPGRGSDFTIMVPTLAESA